jgi:AcrR family transcriptional regulator
LTTTDGRHARAERTRAAVAEAMLDCFEAGLLRPAASEVAERAGVSTRAVFRHFDNMESLLEQAAELQNERVARQLPPLSFEGPRDERVDVLVARTSRAFELTTPVRRAALLIEPFSQTIRDRQAWLRAEVRRSIRRSFAPELDALAEPERRMRVAGLRALLSFSYWDELRQHERLSVAAATKTLTAAIHASLGA